MAPDLPPHLQPTKALLAASLRLHPAEEAPPVPADLLNDLDRRFNPAPATAAPGRSPSWLATVQSFIARPAFGMAAFAVVILGTGVPLLLDSTPDRQSTGFRGALSSTTGAQNVRVILIKPPPDLAKLLHDSGDFEDGVISTVNDASSAVTGARVEVNFTTSTITALNAVGDEIYSAPLPGNPADLPSAIATAVSRL